MALRPMTIERDEMDFLKERNLRRGYAIVRFIDDVEILCEGNVMLFAEAN